MKKYDQKFYKKLPLSVRQSIFEGAMSLAAGFLAFDSTNVAGTGGGPAALLGRIGALELAEGWLLKVATDMALEVQLTVIQQEQNEEDQGTETNPPEGDAGSGDQGTGTNPPEGGTDSGESKPTPEDDFINAENKHTAGNSSSVQQIQIVNEANAIVDLSTKLDDIIAKL